MLGHDVLPGVLELATNLTSGNLRNGNQVDLSQLTAAAPVLAHAETAATHATDVVSKLPHHTIIGSVDSARATVATQLGEIGNELQAASRAAQILPPMLGADGPKRYFVGFINEGEMRGVGGLPGAFGILLADHGKLSFESFQNDTSLDGFTASVDLGADYKAAYGRDDPTLLYINSDVSPDFTSAAQIWASMWQKKSGEKIDGAIALDPTALSYLLGATGPATTDDGVVVSADNVVSLTQQQLYSQFTDTTARKAYLLTVAEAISHKLLSGGDVKDLARAGAKAAQQRRLLIWSSDSSVEQSARPIELRRHPADHERAGHRVLGGERSRDETRLLPRPHDVVCPHVVRRRHRHRDHGAAQRCPGERPAAVCDHALRQPRRGVQTRRQSRAGHLLRISRVIDRVGQRERQAGVVLGRQGEGADPDDGRPRDPGRLDPDDRGHRARAGLDRRGSGAQAAGRPSAEGGRDAAGLRRLSTLHRFTVAVTKFWGLISSQRR